MLTHYGFEKFPIKKSLDELGSRHSSKSWQISNSYESIYISSTKEFITLTTVVEPHKRSSKSTPYQLNQHSLTNSL